MAQLYDRCTKFYLLINEVETEIAEPINWSAITVYLRRDPAFYGVNFEFSDGEVSLQFDCEAGKEQLDTLYNVLGNDAEAFLLFDELPDGVTRNNLFTGKLDFNTYECNEFTSALSVKRVYFGDLLRSRLDYETSLSQMLTVDGNAAQNPSFKRVELHSKTIRRESELLQQSDENLDNGTINVLEFSIPGGGGTSVQSGSFYVQWGFDSQTKSDLNTLFLLPLGESLAFPDAWIYEASEGGLHNIDILLRAFVGFVCTRAITDPIATPLACGGDGYWNDASITTRLRHTDSNDVIIGSEYVIKTDVWSDTQPTCHNEFQWRNIAYDESFVLALNMSEGDKLYLYSEIFITGIFNEPLVGPRIIGYNSRWTPLQQTSYFNITADTLTPPSEARLMLVHEALTKLVSNITGVNGAVKSDYFGRTDYFDRTYASDGCGGFLSVQNGLGIRGFNVDDKPAFVSLNDMLESLQAIYNIGVQFSTETRAKTVEVWQRRYDTLTELEAQPDYEAEVNSAYTYTVLLQADPLTPVRNYSAQAEIYCDAVLVDTLSIDQTTTSDSYVASGCSELKVVIINVVDGQNTDFARLQILETQPSNTADLLIVEPFDFFFNETQMLEISSFENYTEEVATDYIYNSIATGYEKWENERVNGLDEFATRQQNSTPIRTQRAKKEAISRLVASGYAIEFTRRLRQSTEDSDYDNDIFAIQLRKDGSDYVTEKDEPFAVVSNLIDPATAYNLRISPKRMLFNWATYLNGCLFYKIGANELKFQSGEGNYNLVTQFDAPETCNGADINKIALEEGGNITLSNYNDQDSPIRPEIVRFRAVLSFDELLTIKDAPYGYISVLNTPKGNIKGYLLSLEYKPDIEAGWTNFVLLKKS